MSNQLLHAKCCVCRKVKIGDRWFDEHATKVIDVNGDDDSQCTHGYCPDCLDAALAALVSSMPGIDADGGREYLASFLKAS